MIGKKCVLKTFVDTLSILSALVHKLSVASFVQFFFANRLVKVTLYGSQIKLYNIETAVPSVLKPDLIDV